jgi:hypothetical protein
MFLARAALQEPAAYPHMDSDSVHGQALLQCRCADPTSLSRWSSSRGKQQQCEWAGTDTQRVFKAQRLYARGKQQPAAAALWLVEHSRNCTSYTRSQHSLHCATASSKAFAACCMLLAFSPHNFDLCLHAISLCMHASAGLSSYVTAAITCISSSIRPCRTQQPASAGHA